MEAVVTAPLLGGPAGAGDRRLRARRRRGWSIGCSISVPMSSVSFAIRSPRASSPGAATNRG